MTGYRVKGDQGRWTARAACIGMDTDIFFPSKGNAYHQITEAKAACAQCPVQGECLDWALAQGQTLIGIFGGMTDNERRQHLRAQRREHHAA